MEKQYLITPSRQCSSATVGLVKYFLANNNVTRLEPLPHSPDVVPADFYLFARLKSALKGRGFCDATDIIKNATEELKMLSQNDFQESSKRLHSRWQ